MSYRTFDITWFEKLREIQKNKERDLDGILEKIDNISLEETPCDDISNPNRGRKLKFLLIRAPENEKESNCTYNYEKDHKLNTMKLYENRWFLMPHVRDDSSINFVVEVDFDLSKNCDNAEIIQAVESNNIDIGLKEKHIIIKSIILLLLNQILYQNQLVIS